MTAGHDARPANSWTIGRMAIAAFVVFHSLAVGLYAIPEDAKRSGFFGGLQQRIGPITSPYVLITSQWQQWNLFSPDPLRQITKYRIEVKRDGAWRELVTIEPGVFPWWEHAIQFKLLMNVMEGSNSQIAERYVQEMCVTQNLPPTTPLRVVYVTTIIPWTETPMPKAWWAQWKPTYSSTNGFETACPTPLTSIE